MLLGDLLLRRKLIKLEINELKNYLFNFEEITNVNEILNKLFELEDQFQRHNILIERANNEVNIEISNSKTSLSNAVKLRDAVDNKADTLTKLINNNKSKLSIINLMEQRQKFIEEFVLLNNAISKSDWSVNVD